VLTTDALTLRGTGSIEPPGRGMALGAAAAPAPAPPAAAAALATSAAMAALSTISLVGGTNRPWLGLHSK